MRFTGEFAIPSGHKVYTVHSYTNGQCRAYIASIGISATVWEGIRYEGHFDSISDIANALGNVAIREQPRRLVILTTADGVRPDNGEPYAPGIYEVRYSQAGTPSSVNRVLFWTDHPPGEGLELAAVTPSFVAAAIQAHAAVASAHHTLAPTEGQPGGSVVDVIDGRLPAPAVSMRLGWSQSQAAAEGVFTRANDHPIDGASVGDTDGLDAPPFPPSLASDSTLYLHLWIEGSPSVAALQTIENVTAAFSDGEALTVDGVAGTLYVAANRYTDDGVGVSYRALLVGALLATVEEVTAKLAEHASIANVHHAPPDVGEHIDQTARDAAAAAAVVAMAAQTAAAAAQATAEESTGVTIAQVGEVVQAHAAIANAHHTPPDAGGGAVQWEGVTDYDATPPTENWSKVSDTIIPETGLIMLTYLTAGVADRNQSKAIPCSLLRSLPARRVGAASDDDYPLVWEKIALGRSAGNELLLGKLGGSETFYFHAIFSV